MICFLILIETIYNRRDDSDEGSQHMVLCRINKKLSLIIIYYSLLSRAPYTFKMNYVWCSLFYHQFIYHEFIYHQFFDQIDNCVLLVYAILPCS